MVNIKSLLLFVALKLPTREESKDDLQAVSYDEDDGHDEFYEKNVIGQNDEVNAKEDSNES